MAERVLLWSLIFALCSWGIVGITTSVLAVLAYREEVGGYDDES